MLAITTTGHYCLFTFIIAAADDYATPFDTLPGRHLRHAMPLRRHAEGDMPLPPRISRCHWRCRLLIFAPRCHCRAAEALRCRCSPPSRHFRHEAAIYIAAIIATIARCLMPDAADAIITVTFAGLPAMMASPIFFFMSPDAACLRYYRALLLMPARVTARCYHHQRLRAHA